MDARTADDQRAAPFPGVVSQFGGGRHVAGAHRGTVVLHWRVGVAWAATAPSCSCSRRRRCISPKADDYRHDAADARDHVAATL